MIFLFRMTNESRFYSLVLRRIMSNIETKMIVRDDNSVDVEMFPQMG